MSLTKFNTFNTITSWLLAAGFVANAYHLFSPHKKPAVSEPQLSAPALDIPPWYSASGGENKWYSHFKPKDKESAEDSQPAASPAPVTGASDGSEPPEESLEAAVADASSVVATDSSSAVTDSAPIDQATEITQNAAEPSARRSHSRAPRSASVRPAGGWGVTWHQGLRLDGYDLTRFSWGIRACYPDDSHKESLSFLGFSVRDGNVYGLSYHATIMENNGYESLFEDGTEIRGMSHGIELERGFLIGNPEQFTGLLLYFAGGIERRSAEIWSKDAPSNEGGTKTSWDFTNRLGFEVRFKIPFTDIFYAALGFEYGFPGLSTMEPSWHAGVHLGAPSYIGGN